MSINDTLHDLLNKARIIGRIKEGQKLNTTSGIYILDDNWKTFLMRKWYGDNKESNVRNIRDIYRTLGELTKTIVTEYQTSAGEEKNSKLYTLKTIADDLRSSVSGLHNLSVTYASYATVQGNLEGIVTDYIIVTYRLVISKMENVTDDLIKPIMYNGKIVYDNNTEQKNTYDFAHEEKN